MSSLKDQLSFYYSYEDFELFIKIIDFFEDKEFTYDQYKISYRELLDYIFHYAKEIPDFIDDNPDKLLQLLYGSNVIFAIESRNVGEPYYSFAYREKDSANIDPKVPLGKNVTYKFHYGIYKKAKLGRF